MWIIKNRIWALSIGSLLVVSAVALLVTWGLPLGIEFTGGTFTEVSYETRPALEDIRAEVEQIDPAGLVQDFGENGAVIRTKSLSDVEQQALITGLEINEQAPTVERLNVVGPSVGQELRTKALLAIVIVLVAIILFMAYAFRKVSEPVASWKYGLAAIAALAHDVLVPTGIFILLGKPVDTLFVVGLLSILGLSVNDTIVVFDRVRENLEVNQKSSAKESFVYTVGRSITQTLGRSINTSGTLVAVLVVLWLVGPEATQDLALVMGIGTILGTYSSLGIASPLLALMGERAIAKKAAKQTAQEAGAETTQTA